MFFVFLSALVDVLYGIVFSLFIFPRLLSCCVSWFWQALRSFRWGRMR